MGSGAARVDAVLDGRAYTHSRIPMELTMYPTTHRATLSMILFVAACGGEPMQPSSEETATGAQGITAQQLPTQSTPQVHAVANAANPLVDFWTQQTPPQLIFSDAVLVETSGVSPYSGRTTGRKIPMSRPASDNDAMTGVTIGERSDDPCYLRLLYKDVLTGATGSTRTFDECDGDEGDVESVSLPSNGLVTGVRICLNSDRDKLKGIELIGNYGACLQGAEHVYLEPAPCSSVFNAGGSEYRLCDTDQPNFIEVDCRPDGLSAYIERTNCDGSNNGPDSDWESEAHCPAGMVATGVTLNVEDGGGDREMYNGIQLQCDDLIQD